jgi:effector-binding domain-containing protein
MAAAAPTQEESLRNPFAIKMNIFNNKLLEQPEKVPFMKYFIKARRECFSQIMFNFMGYFLALTTKEELFCVPHDKLREYGVIKTNRSNDILTCLKQYGLEENEDFTVRNVPQRGKSGATYKKMYTLSQDAFKLCLMRAKNSRQFANYYLMLEKVIGFHQKYLDSYTKQVIAFKDGKIDEQIIKIDQQTIEIQELRADMRRMLERTDHVVNQNNTLVNQNNTLIQKVDDITEHNEVLEDEIADVKTELVDVKDELVDVKDELKGTSARLDAVESHLDQRNIPPENPILSHEFVLIKMPGTDTHDEYTVIRGQKKTVHQKIKSIPKGTTITILHKELEPNPIDAFNRLKDEIKNFNYQVIKNIMKMKASKQRTQQKREYRSMPTVAVKNTTIRLRKNNNHFNEEALVTMLTEILDEKYEIEVEP